MQRFAATKQLVRGLLLIFSLGILGITGDALGRAGGKRSMGQRSAPAQAQPYNSNNLPPQQTLRDQGANRGSFMKGLAGGLAGGLIGGMLFSSLGHAAGAGGIGAGGIGILEILLIGGMLFLAYRLWKNYQQRQQGLRPALAGMNSTAYSQTPQANPWSPRPTMPQGSSDVGYFARDLQASRAESIDRDNAEDIFFRVQAAWMRRDLQLVLDVLDEDIRRQLEQDIAELRSKGQINQLESIAIRQVTPLTSWVTGTALYSTVRFTANLLDYTIDEQSKAIVAGSTTELVKFEEDWVFVRKSLSSPWQLAGIEQV